eukprot:1080717-Rhodomonas_salina.2
MSCTSLPGTALMVTAAALSVSAASLFEPVLPPPTNLKRSANSEKRCESSTAARPSWPMSLCSEISS